VSRPAPRRVPNDPDRRDRIARAALDLMTRSGLHELTHRRVAALAGVPLGSTTYHFAGRDELLLAAIDLAIADSREQVPHWRERFARADDVCDALAEQILEQTTSGAPRTVLAYELYTIGLRRPEFRSRSEAWIGVLRESLLGLVDQPTADALTATADGAQLQALLSDRPPDLVALRRVLHRVHDAGAARGAN
jgi:DNA-binding transcriptional regulator YbjK